LARQWLREVELRGGSLVAGHNTVDRGVRLGSRLTARPHGQQVAQLCIHKHRHASLSER